MFDGIPDGMPEGRSPPFGPCRGMPPPPPNPNVSGPAVGLEPPVLVEPGTVTAQAPGASRTDATATQPATVSRRPRRRDSTSRTTAAQPTSSTGHTSQPFQSGSRRTSATAQATLTTTAATPTRGAQRRPARWMRTRAAISSPHRAAIAGRAEWCSTGGRCPSGSRTRPRRPPARFPTAASRRSAVRRSRQSAASAQYRPGDGDDQGQRADRQQPADLTAHLCAEQPAQTGLTAESPGESAHRLGRSVAGAEDPPQSVVADHEVPGRAVLAAADVGAVARPQGDHGDPPQGGRRQDGSRAQQTPHSRYPGAASSHEPGDGERGDDHPGGEHFGEESAPDQEAARAQPPGRGPALGLQRTGERVRRRHQQQDQQRVPGCCPG